MDDFNGMRDYENYNKTKKCATDAKCDCPAFTEGFRKAEEKFFDAERNDGKLNDAAGKVIGDRLKAAVDSHN